MTARSWKGIVIFGLVLIPTVWLSTTDAVRAQGAGPSLILIISTLALWATGLVAEYVAAMIFFTAAMLLHIASPEVTFSGFSSTAFWLIFPGLFIGVAVTQTGLGDRLARRLIRFFPDSYAGAAAGNAVLGLLMAFIMPSAMGRIMLLLPILDALAIRLGYAKGSRGYVGIVLSGLFGTFFPAVAILPANVPNIVLIGAAETLHLPVPDFGSYLLTHFPVLGILKTVLTTFIVAWMYRSPRTLPRNEGNQASPSRPISAEEIRLAVILAVALVLWCTDTWHHISPAWVGMLAGIACLMPGIGVLDSKVIQKLNLASLFQISAVIAIGAMVSASGIGKLLADALLSILPLDPATPAQNFATLSTMAMLTGTLASQPGIPAVLTPLAEGLASASGLPVSTVLMSQVLGFSTVLMIFQAPPLMVGIQALGLPMREANRLSLVVALASIVVLWPLDYAWWRILGLL